MRISRMVVCCLFAFTLTTAFSQTSTFTYQGRLIDNVGAANGSYDLRVALFDAASGGNEIGALTNSATAVSNGIFTVQLDFGANAFNGSARWLEIGVRTNGSAGSFTTLNPRQPVTSTPYSIQSINAGTAGLATVANSANAVAAGNISGTLALSQLPTAVVTNNASNVSLNGSFVGNAGGLTNLPLAGIASYGSLGSITNGLNFIPSATPATGPNPYGVAVADVNGDGKMDLISANNTGSSLTVLTNNGAGFGLYATLSVGSGPRYVVTTDLNGDGRMDLVSVNNGSSSLTLLTNSGSGFSLYATVTVGAQPYAVAAADVNNDGRMDLISADEGGNRLTVLINNGNGTFVSVPIATQTPTFVAAADLNGDNKPDLVAVDGGNYGGPLTIFTNNGSGTFGSNATVTVASGASWPQSVAVADVNGDGRMDLIAALNDYYGEYPSVVVMTNSSSGVFGTYATITPAFSPATVIAADLDGDGKQDLVFGGFYGGLAILANKGASGFVQVGSFSVGNAHYGLAAADVNGDGTKDLIVANNANPGSLSVLTNASGALAASIGIPGGGGLHFTPGLSDSANVVDGAAANWVDAGVSGSVIAGGGTTNLGGQISANHISSDYSAIGGGSGNSVQANADHSFIGGGLSNNASGRFSTVAGGSGNSATQNGDAIGGGQNNIAEGFGGGYLYGFATVAGGQNNTAAAHNSTVGGGHNNLSSDYYGDSTVAGGENNTAEGYYADTVSGGANNTAQSSGGGGATVGGGIQNVATNDYATVPGGNYNVAGGQYSLAAGRQAQALHQGSFVWADSQNAAFASTALNQFSVRAQGGVRFVTGVTSFTGTSASLTITPDQLNGVNSNGSVTLDIPGIGQKLGIWDDLVVSGSVTATGFNGSGVGLTSLDAGNISSGTLADARLSSNVPRLNASQSFTGRNTFSQGLSIGTASALEGDVNINTNVYLFSHALYFRGETGGDHNHGLAYNGQTITNFGTGNVQVDGPVLWGFSGGALGVANGGQHAVLTWTNGGVSINGGLAYTSDRNMKTNFAKLDSKEVLERVAALPVTTWSYNTDPQTRHVGPVAQDFHEAFAMGNDDKHINIGDETGVALAAIKGLNEKLDETRAELKEREAENANLKARLEQLEKLLLKHAQ